MLIIYIYIPIFITPGNDLVFFLQTTPLWGFLIFISLALLMGLLISMQIYSFKELKKVNIKEGGTGVFAGLSSIISGVFSSATCASCISTVLAFLSVGSISFLLEYRWHIAALGFVLVLLSLFLTSRKVKNHCKSCGIKLK